MNNTILLFFCIIILGAQGCQKTALNNNNLLSAIDEAKILHNSCLIVRIPTSGTKIKYLRKRLTDSSLSRNAKSSIKSELEKIVRENNIYFEIINSGFRDHYNVSPVYYIPDTLFKSFLLGNRNVFLDDKNRINDGKQCNSGDYFLILPQNNIEQLTLTDKNGNRLDYPFPYRKTTFLMAFKRLFDRKNFVHNQIKWFNEKLNNLLTLGK